MEFRKKGKVIHSEARNMARSVIKKCEEEGRKQNLRYPLRKSTLRACDYTGLSKSTVLRIRKEDSKCGGEQSLSSPGKKRARKMENKYHCSEEDKITIGNIIHEFYLEKKQVSSGPKLLTAIKEKIDFPWKIDSLHRLLKSMGFQWRKCASIKKILIEKPNIVTWRAKYLKAISHYRKEKRNIIYIDETWVDNTMSFNKCWQSEDMVGILKNSSCSHRFIVIHAGGRNGFVEAAKLIFKARGTSGDYHGQMNGVNFEKWLTEKLLPNIPAKSVIVMDNAPYHTIELNKPPTKYSLKTDMVAWLVENKIPCNENMRKYELLELVNKYKKNEKTFKADEILKLHGHSVLRIPPYMCELNPIELAWAKMKRKIKESNPSTLSAQQLEKLTDEAISTVSKSDWEGFCHHVEQIEKNFWEKDAILEDAIDELHVNCKDTESEDESDSSNDNTSSEDL